MLLLDVFLAAPPQASRTISANLPSIRKFINLGKRNAVSYAVTRDHPYIPSESYPAIFPLYNPSSVDFIVFWEIPAQRRSGHIFVPGVILGATHAPLKGIIAEAERAKVKRSMYAETQREKIEVLDAIRGSEWNAEMNPVVLSLQEISALGHDFKQGSVNRTLLQVRVLIDVVLFSDLVAFPSR